MKICRSISEISQERSRIRKEGKSVALVPTMGALHQGHLSLVDIAREEADIVVMTLFVNSLQFDRAGDLAKYPKQFDEDVQLAQAQGVDVLFAPSHEEIYGVVSLTTEERLSRVRVLAGNTAEGFCGASRPGFFDGIVTVVSILFNITQPDVAVFGDKDYQQVRVVQQLVEQMSYPIRILAAPLIRDTDGLALNSRNQRLSVEQRFHALRLNQTLFKLREMVQTGERSAEKLKEVARQNIEGPGELVLDYIEIVDCQSLKAVAEIETQAQALAAVFVGDIRLIDNILLEI